MSYKENLDTTCQKFANNHGFVYFAAGQHPYTGLATLPVKLTQGTANLIQGMIAGCNFSFVMTGYSRRTYGITEVTLPAVFQPTLITGPAYHRGWFAKPKLKRLPQFVSLGKVYTTTGNEIVISNLFQPIFGKLADQLAKLKSSSSASQVSFEIWLTGNKLYICQYALIPTLDSHFKIASTIIAAIPTT